MAFQVQGSVLVDGEWVSRTADVYHIMARNQQQEDTEMREPVSRLRNEVPDLGILSRTIVATPFYKFVLPANIRHKDLNDVVFIGEDSVQLKEICDYGHLRHVATKSDFNGHILAARVFGDPRKTQLSSGENPLLNRPFVHRARRSMTGEGEPELPPEVIVLTLSSRTLMFLWATNTPSGAVTFRQKTVRLPGGYSQLDRPGPFLAIDPKCRAVAVAPYEGALTLYKTRSMHDWRDQVLAGHDELPILDEAVIPIEGRIRHMEFLSSGGSRDDSHVVLVFVLVHNDEVKVACYDWDFRQRLDDSSVRKDRSLLGHENRNPLLLIPLSSSPDFLLICDNHVTICRGILSGPPDCPRVPIIPPILAPLRPGDGKNAPRWVQWDRAPRNPDFSKEAFYVAREDGRVMFAQLGNDNNLEMADAGSWPYPIDIAFACLNVDNSEFAQSYPDVLIAGGAGSDGHLCKVGAWPKEYHNVAATSDPNTFAFVESIPNWAPLSDLAVTRFPGLQTPHERDRAGIFVTNGKAPHGEISELRLGLKAVVDHFFDEMQGSTGLWIIDHGSRTSDDDGNETREYHVTFIVALPLESIVIHATRSQMKSADSQETFWSAWDSGSWKLEQPPGESDQNEDHVIREDETIAACSWADEFAIQITRREARILRRIKEYSDGSLSFPEVDSLLFPVPLLRAATRPGCPFIAVCSRENNQTLLKLFSILRDGRFGRQEGRSISRPLPCDPSCVELLLIDDGWHIFVGTTDSSIRLFRLEDSGNLASVYDTSSESDVSSGPRMVYESAVVLTCKEQRVLVCGTRDGRLVSRSLRPAMGCYELVSTHVSKMGYTAARITSAKTDPSTAFVACGSDFCRIRCSPSGNGSTSIDSIWLVDSTRPAYSQGPIAAIDQLPLTSGANYNGRDLGGFMFVISGDHMVFAQLDYDVRWSSHDIPPPNLESCKVVPRKLPTTVTPTKLMYVEGTVRKIAVATVETKEEQVPPNGYRTMHSYLKLLDPYDNVVGEESEMKQEGQSAPLTNQLVKAEFPLKHYERVHAMAEWIYEDDRGRKYHFLIVGTGIVTELGKEKGRRLVLKVSKSGITLKQEKSYEHPVRCIAVCNNTHIVDICGTTLSIHRYDPARGKWMTKGSTTLPSAGVHMTQHLRFVYVSTTDDSHLCYEIMNELYEENNEFQQVCTDSRKRFSAHHFTCDVDYAGGSEDAHIHQPLSDLDKLRGTIVLLSDKTCSVTGLLHPVERTGCNTSDTLFEACLGRSVTRIQSGDIRPLWRRRYRNSEEPLEGATGILKDDLIGACTDGSIYSFSIINQAARRLLRLLQNVIEAKRKRDPRLQYDTVKERSSDIFRLLQNGAEGFQDGNIKARDMDPESQEKGEAAPRFKHVDGDLLSRFFDEDGNLLKLISEGCDADVKELFHDLVRRLAGQQLEHEGAGTIGFDAALKWAEDWYAEVLMPLS